MYSNELDVKDYVSVLGDDLRVYVEKMRSDSSGAPPGASPADFHSAFDFAHAYLLHNFTRKLPGDGAATEVLKVEALDRFHRIESRMLLVNRTLRAGFVRKNVEGVISDARRKIEAILGGFDLNEFARECGWGKGATSTLKARVSTLDNKVLEPFLSISARAVPYAEAFLRFDTGWSAARAHHGLFTGSFHFTEASRLTTVEKDAKTRRVIDIQPTFNLFLQKGIGSMIRSRLKRSGIDLDCQKRNQELASRAQNELYATIDLANASDTVSSELVKLLIPEEWLTHLCALRTTQTEIEGESFYLNKFSSMGNGFTFELESLIFYGLCYAVVRGEGGDATSEIAVYGDDIIVSQRHAARLIEILTAVGFEINTSKSFCSGRFFESCGKHYFDGFDVTPAFQKEVIQYPWQAIAAHNRLYRWFLRVYGYAPDCEFLTILNGLRSFCSRNFVRTVRCGRHQRQQREVCIEPLLPDNYPDDSGFLVPLRDLDRSSRSGKISVWAYRFKPKKLESKEYALYAVWLRQNVSRGLTPLGSIGEATLDKVVPRSFGRYELKERSIWV